MLGLSTFGGFRTRQLLLLDSAPKASARLAQATAMSAPHSAKANGREHAVQLDANDPLKSFRNEFLIPTNIKSGISLPPLGLAQYTHWQLQTARMAMELAFTFAGIR